jgi:hypothetical protein
MSAVAGEVGVAEDEQVVTGGDYEDAWARYVAAYPGFEGTGRKPDGMCRSHPGALTAAKGSPDLPTALTD